MSIPATLPPAIPPAFRALVDDAAVFPPGEAPLPVAVAAHADHLRSAHRDLVGPFVIGAAALPEVARLATADLYPDAPLRVSVVVPAPSALPDVVGAVRAADRLELAGLEVKLVVGTPYAAQVTEVAHAVGDLPGVLTYVEVPRPGDPGWPEVADAVAAHGLRLKLRTGGVSADLFPTEWEVATWISGAAARRTPFKCTAGLHHAVRHTAAGTGFEHHGYLNVLLAAVRAGEGAGADAVEAALGERDAAALAAEVATTPPDRLVRARAAFASYGSCSVTEPYDDLAALGLLTPVPARPASARPAPVRPEEIR
ncbi:hypothetical protein [Nocardioides alkalitolerans]|uniref:hypothetical protein n=1 Tax=Nocardioides alkalitolerans TaxID=281714 RepID=UPI0003FCD80C|nr:hypothetical protein [Nocardioides alkalitolerans]